LSITVQQLVNLSLRDLNWIRPGQSPSTDESNDAFNTLQEIIANWSQEGLLVPTHAVTSYSLAANTNAYTFGVSATWATTGLPIKIKGAISSLSGFQQGLEIMNMGDFERSIANATARTDALPSRLGYDDAAPQRNVLLWPTPNSSSAAILVTYWVPMTPFVALTDTVAFALPAFEQAVRDELALRQAPMFPVPFNPMWAAKAQASKLALTRLDPSEIPGEQSVAQAQQMAQQQPANQRMAQ
jgi:hypothetical protein